MNYYDAGNNPIFYNRHNHSHGSGSGEKSSWYGKRLYEATKKKLSERKTGKNHRITENIYPKKLKEK